MISKLELRRWQLFSNKLNKNKNQLDSWRDRELRTTSKEKSQKLLCFNIKLKQLHCRTQDWLLLKQKRKPRQPRLMERPLSRTQSLKEKLKKSSKKMNYI